MDLLVKFMLWKHDNLGLHPQYPRGELGAGVNTCNVCTAEAERGPLGRSSQSKQQQQKWWKATEDNNQDWKTTKTYLSSHTSPHTKEKQIRMYQILKFEAI